VNTVRTDTFLVPAGADAPYRTPMRVLAATHECYWLIPVVLDGPRQYARGPTTVASHKLELWIDQGKLRISEFRQPEIWNATDEDLNRWYAGSAKEKCTIVARRDAAWDAIEPLVTLCKDQLAEVLTSGLHTAWIKQASHDSIHRATYLYDSIHRVWAGGSKQALLGMTFRNGGRGAEKPQEKKLGRRNAADLAADRPSSGYFLQPQDKDKLQCGWQCFLTDGRSTHEAYLETMETFYPADTGTASDVDNTLIKDASERPTLRQFRYWGPLGDPALSATRRILGEQEYRNNYRGMPGSSKDDLLLVGQRGVSDSSGGDVCLTSLKSRSVTIGTATNVLVMEALTGVICGMYIGYDPPSARTHLLAAAHAALPKADWCARFGVAGITEDEFPSVRLDGIRLDNGEGRNAEVIRISLKAWEGWLDYAPAGSGRAKGDIEGEHHVRHVEVDHRLPGSTHGPEGPRNTMQPAFLNLYEYTNQHIRRARYHNAEQPAPHLVTGEMRDDLPATATRMDVFRWYVKHGYVNGLPPPADLIRVHMLPSYPATITGHGIFLHRPDRGHKKEFVDACRFVGPYLIESGLLDAARKKVIPAEVSMDPGDPSVAWFRTPDHGLQEMKNVHSDQWLIRHASFEELLFIQDRNHLALLENATRADQIKLNFIHCRDTASAHSVELATQERDTCSITGPLPAPANSAEARNEETRFLEQIGLADSIGKRTAAPRIALASDSQDSHPESASPSDQGNRTGPHDAPHDDSDDMFDDVIDAIEKFEKKV
jgi:putative transposase